MGGKGKGKGHNNASTERTYFYADVAAVRIQDWLGRTPGLIFRRGASALLSKATDPEQWDGRLPPKVRWNPEAGQVDGVVSLAADEDIGEADAPKVLEEAARQVARRMRELMPHCSIQAVAGEGPSYAQAYAGMTARRQDGDYLLDWPSAPPEVILAKPCDACLLAAATVLKVKVTRDDTFDLCGECDARLDAAGRTSATSARLVPAPERRLRDALRDIGMPVRDFSDTFAELAEAGRREEDHASPSQVALIYADGNRVGAFLTKAASAKNGPPKSEIAPAIEQAAIGALAQAVKSRFPGRDEPPVLPHLAGGDDLLISVPAADAWPFTVTLLGEFDRLIREKTDTWAKELRASPPSLSAGLIFHHKTYPFSDVVRLAGEQLLKAKGFTSGREASVAFLDVTADGGQPPDGRKPLTLTYLRDNADRLSRTKALSASRRATLLDFARREDGKEDFIKRLTDLPKNDPLWEFAAGPKAVGPKAAEYLENVRKTLHDSDEKYAELRRALDIARHWEGEGR
ncbi:MAG: hypothetical protein J2P25_12280 [Nocardiopsaceae bacterium]|nr:hypothetical protein [Nocardiopsaceae bacterium]